MKHNFFVEFEGHKVETNQIVARIKEIWKNEGNLVKDFKALEIYYKPEERKCYYIINGEINGTIDA